MTNFGGYKEGNFLNFHAGVIFPNVKTNLGNNVSFQPELLFSVQGDKHKSRPAFLGGTPPNYWNHYVYKFSYIQLPLLFKIKSNDDIGFLLGTQLGLIASRKVTGTNYRGEPITQSANEFDNFKKFDAAVVFGWQLTIQRVTIDARYNLGFVDCTKREYGYYKKGNRSKVIQASVGFSF